MVYVESMKQMISVIQKKIKVLEYSQYAYIGYDAHDEKSLAQWPFTLLNVYPGYIVYQDGKKQYQDIRRIKSTVE